MLEVNNVYQSYGSKKILKGMSFTVKKGEVTCLIGINGSGKSTTMNAIMGLIPIKKGTITIDHEPIKHKMYDHIIYIPDQLAMYPEYTLKQAIAFMQDFYDWNKEKEDKLLTLFKLKKEEKLNRLSKGNKAKANLLLGLCVESDYVLLDEPFSGIDIFTKEQILRVFSSDLIEDKGILLTTHEIGDVETLVDKVLLMEDGRIIREFYAETMREQEGKSIIDVMREVYIS
ncbi:ABC transporter ATP-binding protein [Carnobacteriaceae bacterium zg-ZUI78]|nr:ABC transporter ATP-binding protein [Carnobacteriaceae bacterium zg-ZUI78]